MGALQKIGNRMRKMKKVFTVGGLALTLTAATLATPGSDAHAFSTALSCNDNTYGSGASSSGSAIDDMACTIRNLAVNSPGKAAAIALIGYGFIRAAGVFGQGSLIGAAPPFVAGVGLASAEGLSQAAGYTVE